MTDPAAARDDADNLSPATTAAESLAPRRGGWLLACVIALTFFVATAPTLTWLEFSSSMENLVAATALEIRRTGQWLIPTLETEPRIAKPPLAAWVSAATIRPATVRLLDHPDARVRDAAYRSLAWEIRWPGLLCGCVMLLAVFDLARTIAGSDGFAHLAMLVAGSTLYFLAFARLATTDVQLALWVTIANAAIARLLLRGVTWPAALAAGAALGLALMSKGPVGLLQSIVPAIAFAIGSHRRVIRRWSPVLVGLILMLVVGGAWYAVVAAKVPSVWERWAIELSRRGPQEKPGNVFSYASIFAYMLPWMPVFIFGLIWTTVEAWRDRRQGSMARGGWLLALLLVAVPIVVMSFFPDRKERYLLPLLGPAAILAARGLTPILRDAPGPRVPAWVQWLVLFVIAVGLPIAGATMLKRVDAQPWYPRGFAVAVAIGLGALVVGGMAVGRAQPFALVAVTVLVMLALQPLFFAGYRASRQGRSDLRPLAAMIREAVPDAATYNWRPRGRQRLSVDLSIYLNRPTVWVGDANALPAEPDGRPQVIATMEKSPPGPDWLLIGQVPRDKDVCSAYVRVGPMMPSIR
jgi:4-amino-4-deoxy-L-arabinose transferase-like glycosyltransferase